MTQGSVPHHIVRGLAILVLLGTAWLAMLYVQSPQICPQQNASSLKTLSAKTSSHQVHRSRREAISDYRYRVAQAAIGIMRKDTLEALQASKWIDISELVDVVDEALDTVGLVGVYQEVFDLYALVTAYNDVARDQKIVQDGDPNKPFRFTVSDSDWGPKMAYANVPSPRHHTSMISGGWWWLMHWLGAIAADKLVRDGGYLPLHGKGSQERIDVKGYFKEQRRMARIPKPDILPFHSQHGFDWQYLAMTQADLDTYPTDLVYEFCDELMKKEKEFVKHVHNDIVRECVHGIGHGIYYILAMRQHGTTVLNVRQQMVTGAGFELTEERICEGYKMCSQAPDQKSKESCYSGFGHSMQLYGTGEIQTSEKIRKERAALRKDCSAH